MGKRAPSPPDPVATAGAQAAANKEAAIAGTQLSQVNQQTPWGALTYRQHGTTADGIPQYTATTSLSPDQQRLYETTTAAAQKYADTGMSQVDAMSRRMAQPFSISSMGAPARMMGAPEGRDLQYGVTDAGAIQRDLDFGKYGDPNIERQRVEDAMFERMNPQIEQDRQAMETKLANQGLMPGSQAYDRAYDALSRQINDARLGVTAAAGAEQSRLFDLAMQDANFQNAAQAQQFGQGLTNVQANNAAVAQKLNQDLARGEFQNNMRNAAIQEAIMDRQIPLNEMSALLQGGQVQMPQFMSTPVRQVQPADIMGATYANYNQQAQNANASRQGMYDLLGTGMLGAFKFSDPRLKRDIVRIGRLASGLGVYAFRYLWGGPREIGLMADEVRAVKPWAVRTIGGFDVVNYAEALR